MLIRRIIFTETIESKIEGNYYCGNGAQAATFTFHLALDTVVTSDKVSIAYSAIK